jgi:tetratricopeptide (TPR) repeat protein
MYIWKGHGSSIKTGFMRRCLLIVALLIFTLPGSCVAQFERKIDSLKNIYNKATSDTAKVIASGKLAEYYYIYQLDQQGDSLLQQQLKIAELSQNKNLVFATYFGNAITNINNKWARNETIDRALQFLTKGLNYAKEQGRDDYVALSYIRIAEINSKKGDLSIAFNNADIATIISQNIKNDSIKILATLTKGEIYQARGESLLAFKTFTNAFENAMEANNITLESEAYHRFSSLFHSLKNDLVAKDYLLQSLDLNTKNRNGEGMTKDYIDLAKLTDERSYIEKALQLSDSLKLEGYYMQSKGLMFGYYTYIIGNSDSTFQFLNNNPDLMQTRQNIGKPFYYLSMGEIYQYANKLDSALYYFLLALPGFEKEYKERNRRDLYEKIGQCYSSLGKTEEAISYYEKALTLNTKLNSISNEVYYTEVLSKLYGQVQDYKKAFQYADINTGLKDSLQKLSSQRDIALGEVNNEKRKHERELEIATQQKITKRNLQYMAITIVITVFFFILITIGMFPVSRITVKLLGYFTFISLFEFIILLIEPLLHDLTHGEPLKMWIFKIIIIALLVPLQHGLEHRLVTYLEKRKKKKILPIKKWWPRNKKITDDTIDKIEEDTALL